MNGSKGSVSLDRTHIDIDLVVRDGNINTISVRSWLSPRLHTSSIVWCLIELINDERVTTLKTII